jgi:hypothetical protein
VERGEVLPVAILGVRRVPARDHAVVRLRLDTGAVLEISGAHPTADGRTIGDLRAGDTLDGAKVLEATLIPYADDATYDILPASDSATYFAGGVLIGSTLAKGAAYAIAVTSPASSR